MTKEALKLALEALYALAAMNNTTQQMKSNAINAIKEALAQEQEPLAWISTGPARMIHWTADKPAYGDDWVPLYTTPPQRKPLTEWQITEIYTKWESTKGTSWADLIRAIEAAHNIKE